MISVLLTAEKTNELLLKNMILGPLDQQQCLKHMQMLIRILTNLEAVSTEKEDIFIGVIVDPTQITETTHENRTITWLQIMILARSQLENRMTVVIDVD